MTSSASTTTTAGPPTTDRPTTDEGEPMDFELSPRPQDLRDRLLDVHGRGASTRPSRCTATRWPSPATRTTTRR